MCQIQNEGTFINFMESKHDAHILHLFGMRQCGSVRVCMVKTLKVHSLPISYYYNSYLLYSASSDCVVIQIYSVSDTFYCIEHFT